jgi:phosphoglycolate phosphatase
MLKLVLFDVDGTLLHTSGAGRRAIHAALAEEFGTAPPEQLVRFDGKTDPQIVRELLLATHHPGADDATRIAAVCRRYVGLLETELAHGGHATTVYPGVRELLDLLDARGDAVIGLLTGNLADGARLKLQAAGIVYERFRVGAFGSDHHDRTALPMIAAARAAAILGRTPHGADIVILGDTPADMTCGREVAARAIGVATGRYSPADLAEAGAYAVFDDFSDPARVLDAIFA